MSERESMPVDVVIVGAGPAGLAAAIRLKQLDEALEVVVLEKGSEVGAHILSGAVIDPRSLDELLPDWRDGCPLAEVPVTSNHHWVLTRTARWEMPHLLLPPLMSNEGCYTGSLGNLCRWLAERDGCRHAGHGRRRRRLAQARLPTGHGAACEVHPARGGCAGPFDQAAQVAVCAR
jgi:electron-transferring-flavoprotein dehydrogenase